MRRHTLLAAALAVILAALPAYPAVTKYDADVAHSNVGFSIPILGGLSHVRGKFNDFTATILYDATYAVPSTGFTQRAYVSVTYTYKRGKWLSVIDQSTRVAGT